VHAPVGERLELGRGAVVARWRLVGDETGDHIGGHGLEHRVRTELGVIGEHHDLRRRLDQSPVDARGEHVGRGQPALGGQPGPGQEGP
jgi:hypothetical protein